MENRRQHYIPQFYLNKFVDPIISPPMMPFVWVFKKEANESRKKAPINTAYGMGFYDLHLKDGTISIDIEKNLMLLENRAAEISKKIEKGCIISKTDRMIYSEFIWTMQMRTPYQRNNLNKAISEAQRYMMKIAIDHPECLKNIITKKGNNEKEITDIEMENLIEIIKTDRFDITVPQEYSISNMVTLAEEFTKIIYNMNWCFLMSPEDSYFITSDNPVIIKDPKNTSCFYGDGYLSSKSIELTFPISPSICLLATWAEQKEKFVKTNRVQVNEINNRICKYFNNFIFSSKKMFLNPKDMRLYFNE